MSHQQLNRPSRQTRATRQPQRRQKATQSKLRQPLCRSSKSLSLKRWLGGVSSKKATITMSIVRRRQAPPKTLSLPLKMRGVKMVKPIGKTKKEGVEMTEIWHHLDLANRVRTIAEVEWGATLTGKRTMVIIEEVATEQIRTQIRG